MKSIKYAAAAMLTAVAFTVSAQTSADNESNVESEYLSSIEDVVITELATSEERDNKLVALQYLENAVNEGRTTPDMMNALDGRKSVKNKRTPHEQFSRHPCKSLRYSCQR